MIAKRVALVTGASSGIGASIAHALAANHHVVLSARNELKLEAVVASIRQHNGQADLSVVPFDVRSTLSVGQAISRILHVLGRVDVLINCAGVGGGGHTLETTDESWNEIVDTNLTGVFRVTRDLLIQSGMLGRQWGRVINIASTGGKQGVIFAAAYSASKHGVIGFTKSLALELANTGITVNAICPGFVETPLAEKAREGYAKIWRCSSEDAKKRIEGRIPLGRYVKPDEVAALAEFLASDAAAPILGQAFNVCGGLGNY